jgi:hypothetical protein
MKKTASLGLALLFAISAVGCAGFHGHRSRVPDFVSVGSGYDTYVGYELVSVVPIEIGKNGWFKARYVTDAGKGVAWFNTNCLPLLESNPHIFFD